MTRVSRHHLLPYLIKRDRETSTTSLERVKNITIHFRRGTHQSWIGFTRSKGLHWY